MIVGALGCNLAWGLIDAAMYLMAQLNERGHTILLLQAVRKSADIAAAQRIIVDALPPQLSSLLPPEQLESMRRKLQQMPEPAIRPQLTGRDGLGAAGVCLLVFLSTFPVVIPFMFIADPRLALRVSNAVAIALLFLCGCVFGRYAGFRPWGSGLSMVVIGAALVAIASALGG
jgi:VIT1/CCC1 family predicted Fe2+/Mn2+ transporter